MEFLKKKIGPLPVWAYGLIGVGAYLYLTRKGKGDTGGDTGGTGSGAFPGAGQVGIPVAITPECPTGQHTHMHHHWKGKVASAYHAHCHLPGHHQLKEGS
jgi:hypothetical protein